MSSIENITDKIITDAKDKADLMIAEATKKAKSEAEIVTAEANREKERILQEARALATRQKERIVASTNAEIRDKKLEAKQKAIDGVFAESLIRLEAISPDEFAGFAADFCKNAGIKEGDLIIFPEKYKGMDTKKIHPKLAPYVGERSVSGGFVLISGGVEQNNTFSALLDFLRDDIEPELVSILFGGS